MTQKELDIILDKHKKWLSHEEGGERANLCGADLCHANLAYKSLNRALLRNVSLKGASLYASDLFETDLRDVDILDANLDFSCLPLCCGSLHAHFDDRQLKQIAYHLVCAGLYSKNASEETKRELVKILDFANGFHRAEECGILKNPFEEQEEQK